MSLARINLIITIVAVAILITGMVRMNALGLFSPRPSNTAASVTTTVKDKKSQFQQILAFGDSLTAGTTTSYVNYPYSQYLQQELLDLGWNVQVNHRGMPGWTAEQLLLTLDSTGVNTTGLIRAINAIENLSIVIILVGTNDLGRGYPPDSIVENIARLHQVCYENNVPWTVAIAVPPSAYQSRVQKLADNAEKINNGIREFCDANEDRATFMPFPFPFTEKGENWDRDGLHFSALGYETLGKSLVPVVQSLLSRVDEKR